MAVTEVEPSDTVVMRLGGTEANDLQVPATAELGDWVFLHQYGNPNPAGGDLEVFSGGDALTDAGWAEVAFLVGATRVHAFYAREWLEGETEYPVDIPATSAYTNAVRDVAVSLTVWHGATDGPQDIQTVNPGTLPALDPENPSTIFVAANGQQPAPDGWEQSYASEVVGSLIYQHVESGPAIIPPGELTASAAWITFYLPETVPGGGLRLGLGFGPRTGLS